MFTIRECIAENPACDNCKRSGCALAGKFGADIEEGNRIFVFNEGGVKAVGVLGLEKGKVIVKGVYGDIADEYRDLTCRAMLNVCRNMNGITVRVKSTDKYFLRFGFREHDGGMEIFNKNIVF